MANIFSMRVFRAVLLFGSVVAVFAPAPARACTWGLEPWQCTTFVDMQAWWTQQDFTQSQKNTLVREFYNDRILNELWAKNIEPALKAMTAQLIGARVHMTGAVGGFIDGQSTAEAQLTMQRLQAQALRDYTPGENLCRFGTSVRSLAASQTRAETVSYALAEMAEDRLMNTRGGHSDQGPNADFKARFSQFASKYCNPGDNNGLMKQLCHPTAAAPTSTGERFNRDIDVARTLMNPMTLDLDFTNNGLTSDEEDVVALASNLYGHTVFQRLPMAALEDSPGDPNKPVYLDLRQIAALRSVAQNSFNTIVALRARGTAGSASFLMNVLKEMGMSEDEAKKYLASNTGEPSYNAQMEVLTKKIYQNPNFYVNLMDKPANVKRQQAAMNAIGLIQNRDLFESLERQEMLMSLMLELEIRQEQQRIETDKDAGTGR